MFYTKKGIQSYCQNMIKGLVGEFATESKELLEEYWDRRVTALSDIEKSLDAKLEQIQVRVDKAIDKLTKLSETMMTAPQLDSDETIKHLKVTEQKRLDFAAGQAKISDAHRAKTVTHMEEMETLQTKQTSYFESIANSLEKFADLVPNMEQVIENLTGAIDDFKKPLPKPKKKI